jgi:flagellar biosynthesis/type III secretory pathway chaperone
VIFLEIQLIQDLVKVLDQEAKAYKDILKISKNKTGIIVEGKVAELENIVRLEQSLVIQIGRLEGKREELVAKLYEQLKINQQNLSLSELINNLNDAEAAEMLKVCQQELTKTIRELKNKNELNAKLIKNSLEYIDFSINLFASIHAEDNNYGSTGTVGDTKKRTFFDVKR